MSEEAGIWAAGAAAEDLFCALTGAEQLPRRSALGDALIDNRPVEVKQTSAVKGSRTVNQIRAYHYTPMVIYEVPEDQWYVVPASDLVLMIAATGRARGQHNGSPYICTCYGLPKFKSYKVTADTLLSAVHAAFTRDDARSDLRELMETVIQEQDAANLRTHALVAQTKKEG